MSVELSFTTIQIIAASKIILGITATLFFLAWRFWNRPWVYLVILTLSVVSFYAVLSAPLQTFFWGTQGDELFVAAQLSNVMHGNFFHDFYYHWLPPFYPPLYFWITGLIGGAVTASAVGAGKIGVLLTLAAWWVLPYGLFALFSRLTKSSSDPWVHSRWFWLLVPTTFFLLLDFDALILKPYETLPALVGVVFAGGLAQLMAKKEPWTPKLYLILSLIGGTLFLTYYFWWFIFIPVFFLSAAATQEQRKNVLRVILMGVGVFVVASIYLVPLLRSFLYYGNENWQAFFFIPQDFASHVPWATFSIVGLLSLIGLGGLVAFRKHPFIRSSLFIVIVAYLYQFINIILFAFGYKPVQSAKPFLFLVTAALCVGLSSVLIWAYQTFVSARPNKQQGLIVVLFILVFSPLLPQIRFIDNPDILAQIESDLALQGDVFLAENIEQNVPDWDQRTWLTSGTAKLNTYLPIGYYIAHNPHFSHPSTIYSERLALVRTLAEAEDQRAFNELIEEAQPGIDALLFFKDPNTNTYPLLYWKDNYPNGGEEERLDLNPNLIDKNIWNKVHEDNDWIIFLRNDE